MNYIKKLQLETSDARCVLSAIASEITNLYVYLSSPKFHSDTTVQVQDVLNRTQQIRTLASTTLGVGPSDYTPKEDRGYAFVIIQDSKFQWETDLHQGSGGSDPKIAHDGSVTTLEDVILHLKEKGINQFEFRDARSR